MLPASFFSCRSGRFAPIRAFICLCLLTLCLLAPRPALSQWGGGPYGPPGHGNWKIEVSYTGSASVRTDYTTAQTIGGNMGGTDSSVQGTHISVSATQNSPTSMTIQGATDLAGIVNIPANTVSGGVTATLSANNHTIMSQQGNALGAMTVSNGITFKLTWLPEGNDAATDPPPSKVLVFWRRGVQGTASASANAGAGTQGQVTVNCGPTANPIAGPGQNITIGWLTDSDFASEYLTVVNGVATKTVPFSMQFADKAVSVGSGSNIAEAYGYVKVDFAAAGFDLARFDQPESGGFTRQSSDPTYTRWLPLSFSPTVSSQPFRTQSGALPAPWGNLNCYYSLALREEPPTPNYDLFGDSTLYRPSLGADGTYNSPQAPFITTDNAALPPRYCITDASGSRLVYNLNWSPYANTYATLTSSSGNYILSQAGPPDAMGARGLYTYTFQVVTASPLYARLVEIKDNLGNKQTLTWGTGSPLLTVTDSSSGRQLMFNAPVNGYLASVDAPALSGSVPNTHTTTAFDGSGHLTNVSVYAGGSSTLLHSDTFGYGGPNGDAVVSSVQGVAQQSMTYLSDILLVDPFALATPRLTAVSYGTSGDTSSSDDAGSVQGTVQFTYGPPQKGYNNWGVSARTNTVTDARGNVTKTVFELANGILGALTGYVVTEPNYTGAAVGSNVTRTTYYPDVSNPTLITVYDPLFRAGLTTSPWKANLDNLGHVTSITDPLNNTWGVSYNLAGTLLLSDVDPTNLRWQYLYGENANPASCLTSILDPANTVRAQFGYNSYGQQTTAKTPAAVSASGVDEITTFGYDAVTGDLKTVTNPLGDVFAITSYDALGDPLSAAAYPDTGNPATSTTPLTTSFVLNAAQQLTQATLPNGVGVVNQRNNGVLTQTQTYAPLAAGGALLAQSSYSYDTRGRLYQSSDLVGVTAKFRYDKNSNLTRILDGNGNAAALTYGANDELVSMAWPSGAQLTYAYDVGGRVTTITDERNVVRRYLYYNNDLVSDVQFPATPAQNVHYTYDAASRLLSVTDATGSRTYSYEPTLKRLASVTTVIAALPAGHNTFTTSYTYYGDGTLHTITSPVGTTNYTFDAQGRLTSLADPFSNTTAWTYDHTDRPRSQTTTTPSGNVATTFTYGSSGQTGDPSTAPYFLSALTQKVNGATVQSYGFQHSYRGQLTGVSGLNGSGQTNLTAAFGYDGRGRLTSEAQSWIKDAQHTYSKNATYSYDLANNLQAGANGWTVNTSNQVTSAPATVGLPGATGLGYDAGGNLTGLNGRVLGYDCWGRLASVTNTSVGTVTFAYDSAGRRISKTTSAGTTYYLWDGAALIAEMDSGGTIQRAYSWGPSGVLSDWKAAGLAQSVPMSLPRSRLRRRAICQVGSGTVGIYVPGPFGGPDRIIPSTFSNLGQQLANDAWGNPLDGVGASGWGWQHGYRDNELGPQLVAMPYGGQGYAPGLGRWSQPSSPAAYGGASGASPYGGSNPYVRGGGNPFLGGGSDEEAPDDWVLPPNCDGLHDTTSRPGWIRPTYGLRALLPFVWTVRRINRSRNVLLYSYASCPGSRSVIRNWQEVAPSTIARSCVTVARSPRSDSKVAASL